MAMPPQGTAQEWIAWLTSRDKRQWKRATLALGGLTPRSRVQIRPLIAALESPVNDVVFWAVIALGRLRSRARRALPQLLNLTSHPYLAIRQSAIVALVKVSPRDPRVKQAIVNCLADPSPFARREALQALISVPELSRHDLAAVAAAASDSDESVASWSEISLRNIRIKAAAREARRRRRASGA